MPPVEVTEPIRRGGIPRGFAKTGPVILSYGFRPFFLAAGLWAIISMSAWIGALTLGWEPGGPYGVLNWHAHEMLFGYTSAALAGFMLTAIPNWTGRLPVSGKPLAILVIIWLAGRMALGFANTIGLPAAMIIDATFLPTLGFIAAREITAGKNWRNLHVVVALTLLTGANIWFHTAVYSGGDTGYAYRLVITVWLLLISLIGGRLAVSFTRNWLARQGATKFPTSFAVFDRVVLIGAGLGFIAWIGWPQSPITGALCLIGAGLHFARLLRWRGWAAWREPLVLILHIAYGFIPLGLTAIAASTFGLIGPVSALHLLTVGAITNMTFAVMTRATRGHTGNPLAASPTTTIAYGALVCAALLRPVVEFYPDAYYPLLIASATCWFVGFALFIIEYAPMLLAQRRTQ